jgi:type IV pilus assembly protein PilN
MIAINLLGQEKVVDYSGRLLFFGYCGVLGLVSLIAFWFSANIAVRTSELEEQARTLTGELAKLSVQTAEVRDLEEKRAIVKAKLAVIGKLKQSKLGPVRMLDDLNVALPSEVWLLDLSEVQNLLKIRGRALGNQDVAAFMKTLEKSDYIVPDSLNLEESRQMYYDKKTGAVESSRAVESQKTKEFASSSGNKEGDYLSGDEGPSTNVQKVDTTVAIKEFVLQAKVSYSGRSNLLDAAVEKQKTLAGKTAAKSETKKSEG